MFGLILLGIVVVYLLIRNNLIVVETKKQKIIAYVSGAVIGGILSFIPWTLIIIVCLIIWLYFRKK